MVLVIFNQRLHILHLKKATYPVWDFYQKKKIHHRFSLFFQYLKWLLTVVCDYTNSINSQVFFENISDCCSFFLIN